MSASVNGHEVITFDARFCGRKNIRTSKKVPDEIKFDEPKSEDKQFNIKRARYEVIRYGLTGFDKQQQQNNKIAMAIRLGAKPPKKEYINYKDLMEQRRKEKEEAVKNEKKNYILPKGNQKKKTSSKKKNEKNILAVPVTNQKKSSKKKKVKNHPNSLV